MKGTFFFKRTTFVYVLSSDWLNYWFDTYIFFIIQLPENTSHGSSTGGDNTEKTTRVPSRASTRSSTGSVVSNEDQTDFTQRTQKPFSQATQGFSQIQLTQAFSQFQGSKMSNRIRAFAFIALGKFFSFFSLPRVW